MVLQFSKKIIKKIFRFFNKNTPVLKPKKFIKWWKRYCKENTLDDDLVKMIDDHIKTKSYNENNSMWNYLAQKHIKLINEFGLENFRQTIEKDSYMGDAKLNSRRINSIKDEKIILDYDVNDLLTNYDYLELKDSISYKITNLMILNYIFKNKNEHYLNILNDEQNQFGNPLCIKYKGVKYSSATLNSIVEIAEIEKNLKFENLSQILEIGAGWGRLCFSLLTINNNISYTITDIPPTLFIAQKSLSKIFKDFKIFKYRKFENFEEIKNEFNESKIRFLLPDQLKLIPNKYFDLTLAVDCLHELNKKVVDQYFDEINRLSKNFYFKAQIEQWANFEKHKFNMNNYPIKSNWKKDFHKKCHFQNDYFHALYKID